MIVALAILAAVGGVVLGGAMPEAAVRSLDAAKPALVTRADLGRAIGRADQSPRWVRLSLRIVTAGLACGIVFVIGARWVLPAYLWFVAVTLLLTVTDLTDKLIPNRITFTAGPIGAALLAGGALLDGEPERILWAAIGAGGYFLFMLILALIVPGGLGFGDVKLAPILGGFVAAEHLGYVVIAAIGSYVIGGATSAVLLITRVKSRKDTIPFGPYMVIAAYGALFFGRAIVDWYLG